MSNSIEQFQGFIQEAVEALDSDLVNRVFPKIETLTKEPRPAGCRKLKGEKLLWRIRIGDYRVIYAIYDGERRVEVITIRHRSKAYE
jgi:mRNA interferase RelE/StbE